MFDKVFLIKQLFISFLIISAACGCVDQDKFPLVSDGKAVDLVIDDSDYEVVTVAAKAFADDVKLIAGTNPEIHNDDTESEYVVYIGTYGKNKRISELEKQGKLDCSHINKGQWESFIITVVDKPFNGVNQALVIAGSDRRGTAFGVFELSQMIGVSPWVWWADVNPEKKEAVCIEKGFRKFGPPSVKYRGIFLNDEDWGLQPWAARTYDTEVCDIGPKTYAKIFELLLRLKANHIWPAMHGCTRAFNYFPKNKLVTDKYAIVMGSSHCEPLLYNNTTEWDHVYGVNGSWRYDTNRQGIIDVLDKRVKENGKYENVYTVGLRGIHDSGMAGETLDDKTRFLAQAIKDQRAILAKYIDKPVDEIPQVFIPYKEVLPIFENGLDVPDDVALMWADDNYSYVRQFSSPQQQKRPGGGGIYNHISYLGAPHSYLWLNTTPPALIWKEVKRAWDTNAKQVWIFNVGDIKPGEIAMEFALQAAWDIDKWNEENVKDYLVEVLSRDFGGDHAKEMYEIMQEYYRLNFSIKPEFMDFRRGWNVKESFADPHFSLWKYGDEYERRLESFERLYARAEKLSTKIPQHKKDAYFQLVLYPVTGATEMNKKILYAYKSRAYAKQGRVSANKYAKMSKEAFEKIKKSTNVFNDEIAGGKWKYMMTYKPMKETVYLMPPVSTCEGSDEKGLAVAIEGQENLLNPASDENKLPVFNRYTKRKYFIDLVAVNKKPVSWEMKPSDTWIKCSKVDGVLDNDDERVWVDIDYDKAPNESELAGNIKITSEDVSYDVAIEVFNEDLNINPGTFIQDNGVISINAENYASAKQSKLAKWKIIEDLGYSGKSVGLFPFTGWYINKAEEVTDNCPVLTYPIHVIDRGRAKIRLQAIPAFSIVKNRPLLCAASIDGQPPVLIELQMGQAEGGSNRRLIRTWEDNVLRNAMFGQTNTVIPKGSHTLEIWGTDPSIILDKIFIDFGDCTDAYFGPAETKVKNSS